jgi:carbon-monoxide dehydrogenase medium subunit
MEEPESVAEVTELLSRFGESAKIYAGGTELLLAMKEGLVQYEHLINIKGVKGLNEVSAQNGTIKIGALCTHHQLERSAILRNQLPTLVKLEQNVANVRVRHAGTIGGNLCFAEPHADPGTLLLALNATMVVEKSSSKRKIPAAECFVDAYETSLATDELLTEIRIPTPAAETRSAYVKFGYLERPSVGVALVFGLHNNLVNDVKIAVACAGPAPRRIEEAEALLNCKSASEAQQNLAEAGTIAGRASQAISDLHGSQEYKEHIVRVLLKRAFESILN